MRRRPRDILLVPATYVVTTACLAWGGHSTYIALRNRAPVEVTCAELAARRPDAEWLRVTHCEADLEHMGVETDRSPPRAPTVTRVYIPLREPRLDAREPACVLVTGDDPDLLAVGAPGVNPELVDRVGRDLDGSVEGLAMSPLAMSQTRRDELHGLDLGLAKDVLVLDRDDRPRPLWLGLWILGLGGGGVTLIARRRRRLRRAQPVPLPRAALVR